MVTYAQNNTPVHSGFLKALEGYAQMWGAEIIAFKGRYRNPTSPGEQKKQDEEIWYDTPIIPYLMDTRRELCYNLEIFPGWIRPTAKEPLSGFDTHTRHRSGIFPHPKLQLHAVPTPGTKYPKILTTTGAITGPNYSRSKAGAKAQHWHQVGAVVVEIDKAETFHMRHLCADETGSFYDIAGGVVQYYQPDGVKKVQQLDTVVFGDVHVPFANWLATLETMKIVEANNPSVIVLHDLLDFYAENHHSVNDRFLNTAKQGDQLSVEREVEKVVDYLKAVADKRNREIWIVPSNHNDAIFRWLNTRNLSDLGVNAEYFHWLSWMLHKSAKRTSTGYEFAEPLQIALEAKMKLDKYGIQFLRRDVDTVRNGIAYNYHGDNGPNGARGSARNMAKIGLPLWIGHGHSPVIFENVWQVGVKCQLPLSYAKDSPSNWLATDGITYPNGQRQLLNFINGSYYLK